MNRHCVIFNDNQEIKRRTSGAYRFANLIEDMDWTISIVDWVSSWPEEDLFDYLDNVVTDNTLLFAISYTWLIPEWCQKFIAKLKKRYPGRKFIIGGQQFYQHDLGADFYLFGYAEKAIPPILEYLFDGGEPPKGHRPLNFSGGFLVDCNHDYPAMNLKEYSITYREDDYIQPFEVLTIELSRGCRFKCKYCNYAFLGIKEDTSTLKDQLYNELMENYNCWGTRNYIIADDTLNDRESKLTMLAEVVESLPFEPNFAAFIRIDLTVSKPEQLELLSRARVWTHFYGVETLHPEAAKSVGKGMHPDKIKKGLLDMREHMMSKLKLYRGSLGLIAGLPFEPPESWRATEKWLSENWSDNHWSWWPLDISTDSHTHTLSMFSQDWGAYGYREMSEEKAKDIKKRFSRFENNQQLQHKKDSNVLLWEADWADLWQAIEWVQESRDNWAIKKIPNFHLINYVDQFEPKELLELDTTWNYQNLCDHEQVIQPYINKKLGMR
jgi:hypothetical protein